MYGKVLLHPDREVGAWAKLCYGRTTSQNRADILIFHCLLHFFFPADLKAIPEAQQKKSGVTKFLLSVWSSHKVFHVWALCAAWLGHIPHLLLCYPSLNLPNFALLSRQHCRNLWARPWPEGLLRIFSEQKHMEADIFFATCPSSLLHHLAVALTWQLCV